MNRTNPMHLLIGILLTLGMIARGSPVHRDERGLSQSTENAILLAGAVALYKRSITRAVSLAPYGAVYGWTLAAGCAVAGGSGRPDSGE